MAFTPENDLEKAMLNAASDTSARADFYRLLLDSKLVALGTFGDTMVLEKVRGPAGEFHPIFTTPARVDALTKEQLPRFTIRGRQLFEIARGAQFVINPGSVPAKTLTADEIARCMANFPPPADLLVGPPKEHPTMLVKALCILFTARSAIKAAHLVYVMREGIDTEGHPLIGIEADGDVSRLAREIFEATQAVMPGAPIEVVGLDPNASPTPLHTHLLNEPPFFRRALSMN